MVEVEEGGNVKATEKSETAVRRRRGERRGWRRCRCGKPAAEHPFRVDVEVIREEETQQGSPFDRVPCGWVAIG